MRTYNPSHEAELLQFAEEAAAHFRDHPQNWTYTSGEVKAGEPFAVRWNPYALCVFMVSNEMEPTLYELSTGEVAAPMPVCKREKIYRDALESIARAGAGGDPVRMAQAASSAIVEGG